MSALAPGMSDRDPVAGWEKVQPAPRWINPYLEAHAEAWKRYDAEVERQLAAYGRITDKALIDEMAAAAGIIQKLAELAYKQHNCPHYWLDASTGSVHMADGQPTDDIVEKFICAQCGAVKQEN